MTVGRIRVVAALVERGGAFLVQQRRPGARRGLKWEFPGGKVEPGETDQAALARECREELDVAVAVGSLVRAVEHAYADLVVELVLYQCEILEGEPKPLGAHDVRFVPRDELSQLDFCDADVPLVGLLTGARGT